MISESYNRHPESRWTEGKTDELLRLCAENLNLSANQLGKKLGFTRNAIISKIHRLGVKWNRSKLFHPYARATVKPKPTAKLRPQKLPRIRPTFEPIPPSPATEPIHFEATDFDNSIPQDQRKTVLQLNNHTCKWPVGDPGKPDFFFCGAYTDHTYCRPHSMRAYR